MSNNKVKVKLFEQTKIIVLLRVGEVGEEKNELGKPERINRLKA
jgi:hypothetical protein